MITQISDKPATKLPAYGPLGELDELVRDQLAAAGRRVTLPVGSHLVVQGRPQNALWVVLRGKLHVSCHAHGNVVQLAVLKQGDIVGEMSVIDARKASADVVVAEQAARLWTITAEDLNALVDHDSDTGLAIMRVFARELCRLLRHNSESMLRQADALCSHFIDLDY